MRILVFLLETESSDAVSSVLMLLATRWQRAESFKELIKHHGQLYPR